MLTKEQIKQFDELSKPLIKWLCDNCNPHAIIVVEPTNAVVYSGEASFYTEEYIHD